MKTHEDLISSLRALSRDEHDDLSVAADLLESMANWLWCDCECPCCLGVQSCKPGCTFAEDAPSDAERMAAVREVLFG